MSVTIALRKKNGNFILAADSQLNGDYDMIHHNGIKIHKFEDSGIVISDCGNSRTGDLLQCNPELFMPLIKNGKIDRKYLVTEFTKNMNEYLEKYYHHVDEDSDGKHRGVVGENDLIIAYKNEAFYMHHSCAIIEVENLKAIGTGYAYSEGYINALLKYTNKSEEEILTETIKMCSKKIDGVDDVVKIINAD